MTLKKIRNEVSGTIFSLPYFVANENGYFHDEGLDVELVPRDSASAAAASISLIEDHRAVSSFGSSPFEQGVTSLYRACEWGQLRRSQDSQVNGKVVAERRAAVASQAIIVRPDSPYNIPADLAGVRVGVNFHHGIALLGSTDARRFPAHAPTSTSSASRARNRFEALRDGDIDAVAVMEPWITVAEKQGYKVLAEAHYFGLEVPNPDLDAETFKTINRAIRPAVADLKAHPSRT